MSKPSIQNSGASATDFSRTNNLDEIFPEVMQFHLSFFTGQVGGEAGAAEVSRIVLASFEELICRKDLWSFVILKNVPNTEVSRAC